MHNCKDCQHPSCQRIGCDIPGGCPSYTSICNDDLCKSLNDICIYCFTLASGLENISKYDLFREHLETIGHYLMHAQEAIQYLKEEVKRLKEENKMTNYNEVRKFLDEIPTDIAGRITEEFFGWPKGTNKIDIEKWFDKKVRGEDTRRG